MTSQLRNKQGCWTCRLRKKKCDEHHPQCTTCDSLSIPCYGYGSKPECMDGGIEEKMLLEHLKDIVKRTSRRKLTGPVIPPSVSSVRLEQKSSRDAASNMKTDVEPSTMGKGTDWQINNGSSLPNDEHDKYRITDNDSILLMHFLDHVFPGQYPMYKPKEGRGWLLTLLLKAKPFYHASLALSANHRRMVMPPNSNSTTNLLQQEQHFEACLKLLRYGAENQCANGGIAMLAAVIQMMFLDLYDNGGHAWQSHLQAARNMYLRAHEKDSAQVNILKGSQMIIRAEVSTSEADPALAREVVSHRFVIGTLFWLDIVNSITSGKAPVIFSHQSQPLSTTSQVQLGDIFGCGNHIMLQIAAIAQLHDQRTQALVQGQSNLDQVEQLTSGIDLEIQTSLAHGFAHAMRTTDLPIDQKSNDSSRILITQLYTYMAIVYLHFVVRDFQQLDHLSTTILSAMETFQTQIPKHCLPAIIPPLFIIAIAATPEDWPFFRDTFSSPPLSDPCLQHRARILSILELIWNQRDEPNFGWSDCVELAKNVLLV